MSDNKSDDAEQQKIRAVAYSTVDEKLFVYKFTEEELQATAENFVLDIFFVVTDKEFLNLINDGSVVPNNLKADYVWFRPGINKLHVVECTCGEFIESGTNLDKLARKAVRHTRKTGHALNPRGN